MAGTRGRWRLFRRRDEAEPATGSEVDRRTLLVGAAATAGVVAASAAPASASPTARTPTSLAGTGLAVAASGAALVAASDVSVVPVGEIIDTDVQAALESVDTRLAKVNLIDDLQVATTLVDDFVGNTTASGTIGSLGWALPLNATGTTTIPGSPEAPGVVVLGTGTSTTGWQGINLGNSLKGAPVLMCEWRLRPTTLNTASDAASYWFGLHNSTGAEPTTGLYFRYTAADGSTWQAVCAAAGARTTANTQIAAENVYHRFRITSDGAGVARFYIDDALVATITTSLPSSTRYAPAAALRKTAGTTEYTIRVDYFALRFEIAR